MVSFRVSPEEYSSLCQACANEGMRSVSELARAAVKLLMNANGFETGREEQLEELRRKVRFLTTELERVSQRVETVLSTSSNVRSPRSALLAEEGKNTSGLSV